MPADIIRLRPADAKKSAAALKRKQNTRAKLDAERAAELACEAEEKRTERLFPIASRIVGAITPSDLAALIRVLEEYRERETMLHLLRQLIRDGAP